MVAVKLKDGPPTRRQLRHWEEVCCYIDAQPFRKVWYPFPYEPRISTRLMRRMATCKLVRHGQDCAWKLSKNWRAILTRLWDGAEDDGMPPPVQSAMGEPFIVDAGFDTIYVSVLAEELPARLLGACVDLKALAQAQDNTVETPWLWFGAPLSMYKAGVGTKEKDKGVSWGYILRNESVMLLLRKTALNGIVGSVRLSSKVLWTWGALRALDEMKAALRRMWMDPKAFQEMRFQTSQVHLCVDVANFRPQPEDLARIVTRARKRQIHVPSVDDEVAALAWQDDDDAGDIWDLPDVPGDWLAVPSDKELDALDEADLLDDDSEDGDDDEDDEDLADTEGAVVHLWGERASGFAFSPGGALSATWYDKGLQERQSAGKLKWMLPIHEAGGWQRGMVLERIEARFRHEVFRELAYEFGEELLTWVDDP